MITLFVHIWQQIKEIRTNQVHDYNTRASRLFYVSSCRTNIRKFSVNYQGPCFYNSLDAGIRDADASISYPIQCFYLLMRSPNLL